jgi:hypothetical protein
MFKKDDFFLQFFDPTDFFQVNEELLHSALISKCAIAYNEALIMNYKLPEVPFFKASCFYSP